MKKSPVYVVTRDGRRTEDRNYSSASEAKERLAALKEVLAKWDPAGVKSVAVVKTDKPNRIR